MRTALGNFNPIFLLFRIPNPLPYGGIGIKNTDISGYKIYRVIRFSKGIIV